MSLLNRDEAFIQALKKHPNQRTEEDLDIIFSRLHRYEALSNTREHGWRALCNKVHYEWHDANEILYGKDDLCNCWYILLSGSIFIQGSMFLRNTSFGKQIPGSKRRGCQCLVLEPSEMIAIDYPDMHPPLHVRVPAGRNHSTSSRSTLDSVAEVDSSSSESSPSHNSSRASSLKMANGQATTVKINNNNSEVIKNSTEYYNNQDDSTSFGYPDQEDPQSDEEDQEDSISLRSSSSLVKDLVTDVLKKEISERNEDDHDVLLEFTKSLQAFSNMTEPIRRELCKVMVFACVEKAVVLLKENELLDSWSVIINGQVQVVYLNGDKVNLFIGDSFGVSPDIEPQYHKGTMHTMTDDCQFLCIAQQDYCQVLHQGRENMEYVKGEDGKLAMVKEKREIEGGKKGLIVIRGTPDSLLNQLLEENSIDTTYAEDYLLTYRAFCNEPVKFCGKLLEWFDNEEYKAKVTRVILLWVNNHFNDFECSRHMIELLEKFEEKLQKCNKTGECRLFNIACSTKAKSRVITLSRSSNEEDLTFSITGGTEGYPIYILRVESGSDAEEKGLKRGDQLLNVNGQNFEKLNMEKANTIIRKNTDLTLVVKTNLFAFKEMMSDLKNPNKKKEKAKKSKGQDGPILAQISTLQPSRTSRAASVTSDIDAFDGKPKKGGTLGRRAMNKMNKVRTRMFHHKKDQSFRDFFDQHGGAISENEAIARDDSFLSSLKQGSSKWLPGSSATVDGSRSFKQAAAYSSSNPDLLDQTAYGGPENSLTEVPEDVIKVFRADQSYRFVFVNQDTTAEEALRAACKEFGIVDNVENYSLCRVSVQNENFVKQSKLPDKWANLAEIPLSARYYLKNNLDSEQLLPDENIPELLKEANYTFLDLSCFEVALHLTLQDYELFKKVEQTNFIDDLFKLNQGSLSKFKEFEDLVNRELFWVVSTMCSEPNAIRRAKIIKHFAKIAHHCKVLKNLNSTFAIISGLGYRAVSRMKMSWEKVPAKCQRTFDDLQALMDPSRNMSKYRTLLNDMMTQPPVIPYIPVVKKDLTFLHLGNDTIVDNLVNFEKMRMIGREIRNICRLCSADPAQIISSALAHQHEADRPTSNIYHTLTRRGRRSSFNNARKMYEDAMNARRVKQYMQQLKIETDEDKLMEMSKQVELPGVPNSAQAKRRNTTASLSANNESPSRSSKTLPVGPQSKNSYMRNNSEPQIPMIPGLAAQPTRKKNPISSLPKFGATSQQALKKLLSLSEDGDGGSSGSSKHSSLEQKRSGSISSRELSPASSPQTTPRRDMARPKSGDHENPQPTSIAHKNTNRNNNRGHENSPVILRHHPHAKHLQVLKQSSSATSSSSRSSIASSSSLGMSSSSLNAPPFSSSSSTNSSSPRSSPTNWSGPVGTQFSDALYPFQHGSRRTRNSPVRSSSSSSADTVKSAGPPCSDRPVIMQNRSGSFGALSVSTASDRRFSHGTSERRLVGSSSSPSLSARPAASSHHILPNHPQIPRTPSIDSGVLSIGSHSADSTMFLNSDPNEIFPQASSATHQSNSSLALSEGCESPLSLIQSGSVNSHQSPVIRRHLHNLQHKSKQEKLSSVINKETTVEPMTSQAATIQDNKPTRPLSVTGTEKKPEDKDDDIKETFLFGSRGWGDAPLMRDKDPWLIGTDLPPAMPLMPSHTGWASSVSADETVAISDAPTNDILGINTANQNLTQNSNSKLKGVDCDDHVDGNIPQHKQSSVSNSELQQYYSHIRLQERPSPPMSLSFKKAARHADMKTPEAILEEKLLLELEQQKPRLNKSFDHGILHVQEKSSFNLPSPMSERHSASFAGTPGQYFDERSQPSIPRLQKSDFSKSDPSFRPPDPGVPVEYPGYPYVGYCNKPGCKCPASRNSGAPPRRYVDYNNHLGFTLHGINYPPARTSSPKHLERQHHVPGYSETDNIFVSDFAGPMPKTTYILNDKLHSMEDIRSKTDIPPYPFRCPKHGSPTVHPQSNIYSQLPNQIYHQHPTQSPNSPIHPRNSTPDTPRIHFPHGKHQRIFNYGVVPLNVGDKRSSIVHSRSSSDISVNSDQYSYSDSQSYNNFSPVAMNSKQNFPSPISRKPQYCDLPPEKLSVSTEKLSNLSITMTPKSHQPIARRKSSEWGVTDLDTDNQQQAMQVWASGSTMKKAAIYSDGKDVGGGSSQLIEVGSSPSKTLSKDKNPPPLPPQRNSSYQVTRQLRLSSSTLSPLSSPPTSPTTPVSIKKLLLSEDHPQLVVEAEVEEDNSETLPEKKIPMSNGVLPQMKPLITKQSRDFPATKERTLPTYTQAVSHLNSQNKSILASTHLPTYRNIQQGE